MSIGFHLIGEFEVHTQQRERFIAGELWQQWYEMYPDIFDEHDLRQVESQAHLGLHFYEWLAAIQIFQSTGYLSLVEKYQFKKHQRKQEILKQLTSTKYDDFMKCQEKSGRQFPDLLVYARDYSDWYFCEVKGPTDKFGEEQAAFFRELAELSNKPICMVKYRFAK